MTFLKNWIQAHRSKSGHSFIPLGTNSSSIFVSSDAVTTSKIMLHWLLLLPHTPLLVCRVILLQSPYFHSAYTLELRCWATGSVRTEEWWLLFFFNTKGYLSRLLRIQTSTSASAGRLAEGMPSATPLDSRLWADGMAEAASEHADGRMHLDGHLWTWFSMRTSKVTTVLSIAMLMDS